MVENEDREPKYARLFGAGLSETLRQDRAAAKKAKRKARENRRQERQSGTACGALNASASEPGGCCVVQVPTTPLTSGECAKTADAASEPPDVMIARLYRSFAGQMDQLEKRLNEILPDETASVGDIDKTVKTLASLARTLTVLMEMAADSNQQTEEGGRENPDDLRKELAHRLERLCQSGPT